MANKYCKIGWQGLNTKLYGNGIDHNFQRFIFGWNGLESSSISRQDLPSPDQPQTVNFSLNQTVEVYKNERLVKAIWWVCGSLKSCDGRFGLTIDSVDIAVEAPMKFSILHMI